MQTNTTTTLYSLTNGKVRTHQCADSAQAVQVQRAITSNGGLLIAPTMAMKLMAEQSATPVVKAEPAPQAVVKPTTDVSALVKRRDALRAELAQVEQAIAAAQTPQAESAPEPTVEDEPAPAERPITKVFLTADEKRQLNAKSIVPGSVVMQTRGSGATKRVVYRVEVYTDVDQFSPAPVAPKPQPTEHKADEVVVTQVAMTVKPAVVPASKPQPKPAGKPHTRAQIVDLIRKAGHNVANKAVKSYQAAADKATELGVVFTPRK